MPASRATRSGTQLAWQLVLVSSQRRRSPFAYAQFAGRFRFPEVLRRAYAALLAAAVLSVSSGCHPLRRRQACDLHPRRSIESSPPAEGSDLSTRLFTLSSNGRLRQWHVALDEWRAHRELGGGAGTYAEYWAGAGTNQGQLLDVHNLYLETLAELGPIGLALLVLALLVPLVAAVRARDRTLTAIATGAYVTWLVHVGYDWDWELPGVTAAAILCAGALLAVCEELFYERAHREVHFRREHGVGGRRLSRVAR
jgi:hypothetical protein